MFEIGWTEMLVIAVVMIVVVGPKDLPGMLRSFGRTSAKLRTMAGDFQKQFNEALKEAELDDVRKSVETLRSLNPAAEIRKQLNPFEKAASDVRAGLDAAMKPSVAKPVAPPVPEAYAAGTPVNGTAALPGVAGPAAMPELPVAMAEALPVMLPIPAPDITSNAAPHVPAGATLSEGSSAPTVKAKRVYKPRAAKKLPEIAP